MLRVNPTLSVQLVGYSVTCKTEEHVVGRKDAPCQNRIPLKRIVITNELWNDLEEEYHSRYNPPLSTPSSPSKEISMGLRRKTRGETSLMNWKDCSNTCQSRKLCDWWMHLIVRLYLRSLYNYRKTIFRLLFEYLACDGFVSIKKATLFRCFHF